MTPAGLKAVKLPARSPNLNAYVVRFVRSIKAECLDRIIPLNEAHLRHAVHEYVEHYHRERNHQGMNNELLTLSADTDSPPPDHSDVACLERLGGMLKYYHRQGKAA